MADNPNPVLYERSSSHVEAQDTVGYVFNLIKDIQDPEYPNTLEELAVVSRDQILYDEHGHLRVEYTPTVPHCSMATIIGLCIRFRLEDVLFDGNCSRIGVDPQATVPRNRICRFDLYIKEGRHNSEEFINKQLNDKERVAAAKENPHIMGLVSTCLQNVS